MARPHDATIAGLENSPSTRIVFPRPTSLGEKEDSRIMANLEEEVWTNLHDVAVGAPFWVPESRDNECTIAGVDDEKERPSWISS